MYVWPHEYVDYNGNKRNETFYFNLSKAELQDLEWRTPGGLENYMKTILSEMNGQKLADFFKGLIQKSYGVKDPEGRRFIKNKEVLENFTQTEAYVDLYMLLASNSTAASEFINGVFPKEAVEAAHKQKEMAEKAGISLVTPIQAAPPVQQVSSVPMVEGQQVFEQPQQ